MTTAKTHNADRPNRNKQASDLPVTAVADTEYCCDGMITLQVDQLDNYQRNAYGTTKWATDYAGRNPVEGVNGMIKNDGSFKPASCRVFGTAARTLAALLAAVIHNLKQTRRTRQAENRDNITAHRPEQAPPTPPHQTRHTRTRPIPHPPGYPHKPALAHPTPTEPARRTRRVPTQPSTPPEPITRAPQPRRTPPKPAPRPPKPAKTPTTPPNPRT